MGTGPKFPRILDFHPGPRTVTSEILLGISNPSSSSFSEFLLFLTGKEEVRERRIGSSIIVSITIDVLKFWNSLPFEGEVILLDTGILMLYLRWLEKERDRRKSRRCPYLRPSYTVSSHLFQGLKTDLLTFRLRGPWVSWL